MNRLRQDALEIWRAGVAAVASDRLVETNLRLTADSLEIAGHSFSLKPHSLVVVVGAGKASAGMAVGAERVLEPLQERLSGWVNVPADCIRPTSRIHLHPGRPAGYNLPTLEGVHGTQEIVRRLAQLGPDDLAIVLVSGGGSALLPLPVKGVSLADQLHLINSIVACGASIQEVNTVRQVVSQSAAGGLAAIPRQGQLVGLIISDIIGDPLDLIASGPTTPGSYQPAKAMTILEHYQALRPDFHPPATILQFIATEAKLGTSSRTPHIPITNVLLGSNSLAIEAAAQHAQALGYHTHIIGCGERGEARHVGQQLASLCLMANQQPGREATPQPSDTSSQPICYLSGGEPVVTFLPGQTIGKGGRNQELVLAALRALVNQPNQPFALLSAGTDGEDGPTDAAGGIIDNQTVQQATTLLPQIDQHLDQHNAYPFLQQIGSLLKTSPTQTNVMDLRVVVVAPQSQAAHC
jgi:glycerate 2-kinase